jgi:hypothetical protein
VKPLTRGLGLLLDKDDKEQKEMPVLVVMVVE